MIVALGSDAIAKLDDAQTNSLGASLGVRADIAVEYTWNTEEQKAPTKRRTWISK